MFSNEDVTIGSWMLSMNVNHEDKKAICDPACTANSIAVWSIPRCSGTKFSKSSLILLGAILLLNNAGHI